MTSPKAQPKVQETSLTKINMINNIPFKNIYYIYETNQFYTRTTEKDKPLNWKTIKSTYQKKKNNELSKFEYKYVYLRDDSNVITIRGLLSETIF
jgi:hypothetical protein